MKNLTIAQLDAISLIYKRCNNLELVAKAIGVSHSKLRTVFIKNGIAMNESHSKYKKFGYEMREDVKKDIVNQIEYNKSINYKNLFNDQFVEWLNRKYQTNFKRSYLVTLKKEIINNI